MNNDSITGFKKLDNTKGFTTDQLFDELKKITVSFGIPQMGQMQNKPAVTWIIGDFTVYTQADENFIKIGGIATQHIGKNLLKQVGLSLLSGDFSGSFSGGKDNDDSNQAVEELYGIVTKLLGGETAEKIESDISSAYEKSFYIKQKGFSLKANYTFYLEDETPAYSVTSDLTHLNFSIVRQEQEVLTLKKKPIAVSPEYSLLKNGQEIGHFKKKFKFTTQEIDGQLNGKTIIVQGDITESDYSVSYDGVKVATVKSDVRSWGECNKITVYAPELEDSMIALAIIGNQLAHQAELIDTLTDSD